MTSFLLFEGAPGGDVLRQWLQALPPDSSVKAKHRQSFWTSLAGRFNAY
jgi:hypothetical protein